MSKLLSEEKVKEISGMFEEVNVRQDRSGIDFAAPNASFRIDRDLLAGEAEHKVKNLARICYSLNEIGKADGGVTLNDIVYQDLQSSFTTTLKTEEGERPI